ncbi:MAG TPA: tetratricopeptide repeat protein [Candidatus Limnocylindrales bacterium]
MPSGPNPPSRTPGHPLARLLRAWRERALLTQHELAERCGLGVRTIRRLETGGHRPHAASVRLLADALGLSGEERDILAAAARGRTVPAAQNGPVPRQLPRDTTWFTGRGVEVKRILAAASDPATAPALVISAIDGMAGIGKTALAVHAAHRLAGHFPDGQLFIDLHGFSTGVARVEPFDALHRLLRDVGVPGERIPGGLDERAALWRSLLTGRRMLIVLDNAATEAQVQPLLPGAAGCLVLVTSRKRLAALEVSHTVSLDTLPQADAVLLLVRTADRPDVKTDPAGVREAVELCGRLPLAIRIAAARLKHRRVWTVADLVQRLRNLDARLAALDDGQRSVYATLHLSYQNLSADTQRLYRLLGLHPGPDIDPHAAAALAATTLEEVNRWLEGMADDHLLAEPAPGRYRFHDLVRAHAAETAATEETQARQRAALNRLLDHYRHTTAVAMDVAYPYERHRRPAVPPVDGPTPDLSGHDRANRWLDAELPNLLAAAQHAAKHGWPEHVWQLSAILDRHLRTRGRHQDAAALHEPALNLARRLGNRPAELDALNRLGYVHRMLGSYERASDHYGRALQIAQAIGDRGGELNALDGVARVHWMLGSYEQASDHYGRALRIAQAIGDHVGELQAMHGLGRVHRMLGHYERAEDHYSGALRIAQTIGDRGGELQALNGLGDVHRTQGHYEQAGRDLEQALGIARSIGHRGGELNSLTGLARVRWMAGCNEQAGDHLRQALQIARETGDRSGELNALNGLGHVHRMLGGYGEAAGCYQRVLDLAQELGRANWRFEALQCLGRLHHAAGDPDLALNYHEQALRQAIHLGQPTDQARAHDGLAHAHHALNHHDRARRHWRDALEILTDLGADHTEDIEATVPRIRTHLTSLDQ